nr:hypothetical protein CFP56_78251 [Quercus suber]
MARLSWTRTVEDVVQWIGEQSAWRFAPMESGTESCSCRSPTELSGLTTCSSWCRASDFLDRLRTICQRPQGTAVLWM